LNVEVAHGATFFAGRGVALDSTSSRTQSRYSRPFTLLDTPCQL
jgi:hypothetical protein